MNIGAIGLTGDIYLFHRHVAGLEIGWTLIGALGLIACSRNVWNAFRDLVSQAAAPDRGDEVTAALSVGTLRSDAIRLVILCAAVSVGLISMTVPTPNPEPPIGPLGWSFIALLYVIVIGTATNAILDERLRRFVAAAIRRAGRGE